MSIDTAAPAAHSLSLREKLSYGAGEVASNLSWNMATSFLLFYYTDVALLPVAALGTLMLATRTLDALFDLAAGVLVDRTRSKWGKARPYLLWASVPFTLLCVATFSVPDVGSTGKLVYAYLTFTLLGWFYSLLYVPFSSMLPLMTDNRADLAQLGTFRAMGTSIGSLIAYSLVLPLVALGNGDQRLGFSLAALVLGGLTLFFYLVTFFNCRERVSDAHICAHFGGGELWQKLGRMARNGTWWIAFFYAVLNFVKLGIKVSTVVFIVRIVLHRPDMTGIVLPLMSLSIMIGAFASGFVLRRVGKRAANFWAIGYTIVAFCILPFLEHYPIPFLILFLSMSLPGGLQATSMFLFGAESAQAHERKFGERAEGLLSSSISFGTKIGMAAGAALTAYVLGWSGYTPGDTSEQSANTLRYAFYGGTVLVSLLQLTCVFFYREEPLPASSGIALQRSRYDGAQPEAGV